MNKRGFTLIELLIVVTIIGIVAAIAIPNLLIALEKGKQKTSMGDLKTIGTSIDSYITDWSIAPQSVDIVGPNSATWFQPFYIKVVPKRDAWGIPFHYQWTANTDTYSVYSSGRHGFAASPLVPPTPALYICTTITDFNNDICFSNGYFTIGPNVKR